MKVEPAGECRAAIAMAFAVHWTAVGRSQRLMDSRRDQHVRAGIGMLALLLTGGGIAQAQTTLPLVIRGREQILHLYGSRSGQPIVVSSGDGGWVHLAPHVAEMLGARGFFIVGFDTKAYLASFTTDRSTLRLSDEPGDYRTLSTFAWMATGRKPILIGVSEGAGLSVLAAADHETKALIAGVIGLGLPDRNELGWRWKDAVIYLTHRPPNEPTFRASSMISTIAPVPLAIIQSTHDEFVPVSEAQRIFDSAAPPKRLWTIDADNHRFSNHLAEFDARLVEAIEWVRLNQSR
jgi:fermentation-respiration switch protein FrsA (DUF1100 family)